MEEILPPSYLHLDASLRPLRVNFAYAEAARTSASVTPPLILPPKFLWDAVAPRLRKKSPGLPQIKRRYRPERTPLANLPGGRMNAGQRCFMERVWEPNILPRVIAAGFRRIANIA